jgi:ribose 5-phosphate isomerase RpiB
MNHSELENLVCLITRKVIEKLVKENIIPSTESSQKNVQIPNQQLNGNKTNSDTRILDQHLVTDRDLQQLEGKGIQTLMVRSNSLLTPLALDTARDLKITIQRSHDLNAQPTKNTKVAAVYLTNPALLGQTGLNSLLKNSGFDVLQLKNTPSTQENVLQDIATGLEQDDYVMGIVVDDDIFPLYFQAIKFEGIQGVICWDEESARMARKAKANTIFLSTESFTNQQINQILSSWLSVF